MPGCFLHPLLTVTLAYAVFSFQVDVIGDDARAARREFSVESDISWEDFHRRVLSYLETARGVVELTCKVTGEMGKASHLKGTEDFKAAMTRLCQKANNARSRAVGLKIRNIVRA